MSTLERAILEIRTGAVRRHGAPGQTVDIRIQLLAVVTFIAFTLSIPVDDPASLIWMLIFPVIVSEAQGIGYARIFIRSLWILPLLLVMGILNPIFDHNIVWHVGSLTVTRGWLTLISLLLRGLLTMQALLILISGYGFVEICRTLQAYHCPNVLVTQLLMLYRYIGVLLTEALSMHRARQARGFGQRHYPLKMWGVIAGQLLLRSFDRARRINAAMVARGFQGVFYFNAFSNRISTKDITYLIIWVAIFIAIRYIDLTAIMAKIIIR